MNCCAFEGDLNEVLQLFFACTQLPITAITPQGSYSWQGSCPDWTIARLDQLPKERGFQGEILATSFGNQDAYFYIVPMCPCASKPGFFVLGPYRIILEGDSALSYRPAQVWPTLVSLLRSLQGHNSFPKERRRPGGAGKPNCLPIHRAKKIIHKYYDQDLSLESTAHRLGLNKSYLSTLFSTETGQTFTEYLQEVRVEKSKKLLADHSISVLDVALQVGFTSQNYYSRTFKKLTGMTPSEFRQQLYRISD